jgi:hypothetical protein
VKVEMKMGKNAIFWSCWFAPWEKNKFVGNFRREALENVRKKN